MTDLHSRLLRIRELRDELTRLEDAIFTEISFQAGIAPSLTPAMQYCHDLVSAHFGLPPAAMRSPVRNAAYVKARQFAMAILKDKTKHSCEEIAASFNRVHGTVNWAKQTVDNMKVNDPKGYEEFKTLSQSFAIYLQKNAA